MVNPAFCSAETAISVLGEDGISWSLQQQTKSRLSNIAPVGKLIQSFCNARSSADSLMSLSGADINLVLSELLTNIVKHAYQMRECGDIQIMARFAGHNLELLLVDQGKKLPQKVLENAVIAFDGEDLFELPECGFGWGIVHSIIDEIEYQYFDCSNRLLLRKIILPKKRF